MRGPLAGRSATSSSLKKSLSAAETELARWSERTESNDPIDETSALSATRAWQLTGMPPGDSLVDARDRAILKFCLCASVRLGTGCRLKVSNFHRDGDEATMGLSEKGGLQHHDITGVQGIGPKMAFPTAMIRLREGLLLTIE